MTWLIVIVIAAVVMGAIGYFSSKDGERGENAAAGAVAGAMGCGYVIYVILRIFLFGLGIFLVVKLFGWLFG